MPPCLMVLVYWVPCWVSLLEAYLRSRQTSSTGSVIIALTFTFTLHPIHHLWLSSQPPTHFTIPYPPLQLILTRTVGRKQWSVTQSDQLLLVTCLTVACYSKHLVVTDRQAWSAQVIRARSSVQVLARFDIN